MSGARFALLPPAIAASQISFAQTFVRVAQRCLCARYSEVLVFSVAIRGGESRACVSWTCRWFHLLQGSCSTCMGSFSGLCTVLFAAVLRGRCILAIRGHTLALLPERCVSTQGGGFTGHWFRCRRPTAAVRPPESQILSLKVSPPSFYCNCAYVGQGKVAYV